LVKVLAKNPSDRYLSYDELLLALWAARSQLLIQQTSGPGTWHCPILRTCTSYCMADPFASLDSMGMWHQRGAGRLPEETRKRSRPVTGTR